MRNHLRTFTLLAALTALFVGAGYMIGGATGMVVALVFAGAMNLISYWNADKIVLSMYRAQPVDGSHPEPLIRNYVNDTLELAARAGMPAPKIYVIDQAQPNAFATGRDPQHGAVAVTAGIMRLLSREELAGVIAHELGHIRNRDTLIMTVSAALAGALSHLATMAMWGGLLGGRHSDDEEGANPIAGLLGIILAPIAASLIQMAISRSREYLADEAGARYSGNPMALASALRKIESWSQRIPIHDGNPATAHLFIINPFTGGGLARMFSTHPPTAERVALLEEMARTGSYVTA